MIKKYENHPARKAFEAYGHEKSWDDIIAVKHSETYIALLFKNDFGSTPFFYYVDLTFDGQEWQMQNDCAWKEDKQGKDILTFGLFRQAYIPKQCDWLMFPSDQGYKKHR